MIRTIVRGGLAATIGALCASSALAVPPDFEAKVNAYVDASYPSDGPGAAVIVMEHGKIVFSRGRGLADLETKRAITPDTVFRMASLTKQFTASVILQLEREGKLSLSDNISKFVPDYPEPGARATVAQLLNHTSGIRNFTSINRWMSKGRAEPVTTKQLIEGFKDEPLDFDPGSKYQYNNSGYVLLGAIIEKVTGRPWHKAIDERLTTPLQLRTIRYGVAETSTPAMSVGYSTKEGRPIVAKRLHMSHPHAAGSLIGSVTDFAKWNWALHHGKVLRPAEYSRMIAPTKLPGGEAVPYGFGMGLGEIKGRKTLLHSGDTVGFSTSTIYLPEEDLLVAVFSNSDDPAVPPMVARMKIAAMAVGDPYPEFRKVAVPPAQIEGLLGIYKLRSDERRFFRKKDRLFTRRSGSADQEVFAAGNGRFFYGPTTLTWFVVERNAAGERVMTTHHGAAQTPERSVWAGPIPAEPLVNVSRQVLESYVGAYMTTGGALAKVAIRLDGALTLQVGKQTPVALDALSNTEFRIESMNAAVTFHNKGKSEVGFIFNQGGRTIQATRRPT
jgi:CubicO group peptidase (beta-lactamase class C family)